MAWGTGLDIRNWIFSLQFRLITSFALVLGLALGAVGWYVSSESEAQARRMQDMREEVRAIRVEQALSNFFAAGRGWTDVEPTVKQLGSLFDWRIVLEDQEGQVVGEHGGDLPFRPRGGKATPFRFRPVISEGQEVGTVKFVPDPSSSPGLLTEPPESDLAAKVNRSLLWTGLAAGGAGITLVGLFSRGVLSPVRRLSVAAQRLGRGDLTQRVTPSTRDEVGQLGQTFNVMAEGLHQAQQQRRNLMADVAHELRTPLSNIQGYVEAVRDDVLKADASTLQVLHQQVMHLSRLVEDLRLLALAEAGSLRLHPQRQSIAEVLTSVETAFRPRAEAKAITFQVDLPPEIPAVMIDRSRIEQVVQNLVENSITHTPDGGRLTISVARSELGVRVVLADTGRGIPPDELPLIFERFHRVDPSRSRATGGAGLGLTIAKQLVEAHGGRIWAESTSGQGSRFIFELPAAQDDSPKEEEA